MPGQTTHPHCHWQPAFIICPQLPLPCRASKPMMQEAIQPIEFMPVPREALSLIHPLYPGNLLKVTITSPLEWSWPVILEWERVPLRTLSHEGRWANGLFMAEEVGLLMPVDLWVRSVCLKGWFGAPTCKQPPWYGHTGDGVTLKSCCFKISYLFLMAAAVYQLVLNNIVLRYRILAPELMSLLVVLFPHRARVKKQAVYVKFNSFSTVQTLIKALTTCGE